MRNRALVWTAALVGAGLLSSGAPADAGRPSGPRAPSTVECQEAAATLTVQHRAPVHTGPKGSSPVAWFAARGTSYRIGGYCDNSAGNRWYCVSACDFDEGATGRWVWEEYFRP